MSAFLWAVVCATAQGPRFDGKTWRHHVEVLAADGMEGRATGSPGLQRAEAYVAGQLRGAGLAPAGTNGYYQRIKLESRQVMETDSKRRWFSSGTALATVTITTMISPV